MTDFSALDVFFKMRGFFIASRQATFLATGIILLFSCVTADAQNQYTDSLTRIFHSLPADTHKATTGKNLATEYWSVGSYDSAIKYGELSLELAQRLDFADGIGASYNTLGLVHNSWANYPKALSYFLMALQLNEKQLQQCGSDSVLWKKYKNKIAANLGNIGLVYDGQNDHYKALDYYFRSLRINEELNNRRKMCVAYGNIGIALKMLKQYNNAMEYYSKALEIGRELKSKNAIGRNLGNMGSLYHELKDYDKAMSHFEQALQLAREIGDMNRIPIWLGSMGITQLYQKKYGPAEKNLKEAFVRYDSLGDLEGMMEASQHLAMLYDTLRDYKSSLRYFHKYSSLRDTISNEDKARTLTRLEMQYEFNKKENEARIEQEKKDARTAEEKRKQNLILVTVSVGLLLLGVIAMVIFRALRITRKQKKIIEDQKAEVEIQKHIIEEKNRDITDSINYAKRIQNAMLPHLEDIRAAFPESFVLFKPKDIVSGDFYFFHQNGRLPVIAAADCTGHGVPGGFMSMVGAERLTDAAKEGSGPSDILSRLNRGVKTSLKQTGDEDSTRDGMDIALCEVDTAARIIRYAGANRPLWIIRKGLTEVTEIKATKKAIGGLTEDSQTFETHEIALSEGDTLYLFSDGYPDLFGAEGKKLTTKKFKQLLMEIRDLPMEGQKLQLDAFAEKWKGGSEQIDDILVIGIKL